MPRTFTTASSEVIVTGLGALGFTSNVTMASIVRNDTGETSVRHSVVSVGDSNTKGYSLVLEQTSGLIIAGSNGSVQVAGTLAATAATGWVLVAFTKATGTATPRFHLYNYGTNTASHENAGGTLADPTTPVTRAQIGRRQTTSTPRYYQGDIAAVGVWNAVLTDAQFEALAFSLSAWFAVQPKGLWLLDQSAVAQTVIDLTGGGANQSSITGTTLGAVSVPVFSYGAQPRRRNAIVAAPPPGGTVESYEFLGGGYFPAWG